MKTTSLKALAALALLSLVAACSPAAPAAPTSAPAPPTAPAAKPTTAPAPAASPAVASPVASPSAAPAASPASPSASPSPAGAGAPAVKPAVAVGGPPTTVGLVQLLQHPSLDLWRNGILDGLKAAGYEDGKTLKVDYQNAQGDPALAKSITDKFVADKVDLIISIATPTGQAAVKSTQNTNIPVLFTAVSDAVGAGLVKSATAPSDTNVTGLINFDPIEAQMDVFSQIMPDLKTLGVIYNPGEANSVSAVKGLKDQAAKRGWTIVESAANSSNDVQTSAQALVGRVQAVYMPQDNTVVSAFDALVKVTRDAKLPLFVSDGESVKRGAIATVGNDEYQNGLQAAKMAARILNGEKPGSIPPEQTSVRGIIVNAKAAAAYGVKIPDAVLKSATDVGQ